MRLISFNFAALVMRQNTKLGSLVNVPVSLTYTVIRNQRHFKNKTCFDTLICNDIKV